MKLLGFQISRVARVGPVRAGGRQPADGANEKAMSPPSSRGGWIPIVREAWAGAFQRNVEISYDTVLSHHADFACRTLIASDIAKLRLKLVQRSTDHIWEEVDNTGYLVLGKPNPYQTRIQFFESWVLSKLQTGNTYVLIERDRAGGVAALHVLDPHRVKPLIADDGSVFYDLSSDDLAGLDQQIIAPAREIIHDRFNCFFHPLVGLSPIYAGGLAATQGLAIQNDSTVFFQNGARPGGVLSAPGHIADDTAARLKEYWDSNFSGSNAGKVAVLGDGLHYEAMRAKSTDSQVIEQLRWSAEVVCSTYHVPPHKIGIGSMPAYNNIQALNLDYYTSCLQILIESIEILLDEALGLRGEIGAGRNLGTEFDLDDLLRMDTATQYDVAQKAKGILSLDEQRRKVGVGKITGGDTIYLQQQDHSLAAIAARDAQLIDMMQNPPEPPQLPAPEAPAPADAEERSVSPKYAKAIFARGKAA